MKKNKIGFTCSCFDLLHAGHILMLKDAKEQCDYLIVGLQTDLKKINQFNLLKKERFN